jgi:Putative porin
MRSVLIKTLGLVVLTAVSFCLPATAHAQEGAVANATVSGVGVEGKRESPPVTRPAKKEGDDAARIDALEEALRQQSAQLERLQKIIEAQEQKLELLAGAVTPARNSANPETVAVGDTPAPQTPALEARLKQLEDQALRIGPLRFSGDFRLRADGTFRSASEPPDPPLTHSQNVRARYRLRLNFDTDLYPTLSFHGQLATGPVNNALTLDQDFSSTTVRHPFFISEAWIDYHPKKSIQLQGGRVQEVFADNSRFLFDDDIRFNGFNEKYVWALPKKPLDLSSIEFRAGQYILTNPNVAIITPGSPLAHAGQIVGTTGRSANLFHQGVLFNQQYNKKWTSQFGGDVQLYRNPNQIALASTTEGLVLLIQPGIGLALSGPPTGTGTATTTAGGAIYTARSFEIARATYRLNYSGFEHDGHMFPVSFNFQFARNVGTGLRERDSLLAGVQVGKITKRGDTAFLYLYSTKGANSLISQVTDDDLGTGTGVNIRTNHFRFEYGLAKKVTFQSLFFVQSQLRNSGDFPNFFVPLGAFAPRTYRFQQQIVFSF